MLRAARAASLCPHRVKGMGETVYKICIRAAWEAAVRDGIFAGSAEDIRDGYIHLSTADQLAETAAKHFAGLEDLMLIAVDADRLGPALKWEPSRGGALFPHLYAPLPVEAAFSAVALPLGADGRHVLPEGAPP